MIGSRRTEGTELAREQDSQAPPHGWHRRGHGARPLALGWTFIALHLEATTHPRLAQERVGHSNIKLTMDVYGKLAGDMALAEDQAVRLNALTAKAFPALAQFPLNIW